MVVIIPSEQSYLEELQHCDRNQLIVVSERLSLDCRVSAPKEELAGKIYDSLRDNPFMLVKMLQREAIEFLFELWDMKEPPLVLDPYRNYLQQLQLIGLVRVLDNKTVSVNQEGKDMFFFYLKSHKIAKVMETYSCWEQVLFGMLFYYGILDISYFHEVFEMILKISISYEEFIEFIAVRMIFWSNTTLLRNDATGNLYMASKEVINRTEVFEAWDENSDIGFRLYDKEEYISMALGNGINTWDGIGELFQFITEKVNEDKYECMILIKSIIVMIQNGASYLDVVMKSSTIVDGDKEKEEELYSILKRVFYATPIYGHKGYSRKELSEEKKEPFHIIDGGKSK